MDKSKIKEMLIKAKESQDKSYKALGRRRAYAILKKSALKNREGTIFHNFYLVEEAMSVIRGVRISQRMRYYSSVLLPCLSREALFDGMSAFFEVFSNELTSEECERVSEAFLEASIIALAEGKLDSPEIIRGLQSFDFSPFLLGYLRYEQILRRDSLYSRLDRETRALYKEKLEHYARKRGLSFTQGCERIVDEAVRRGCHIGELLPLNKGESGWLILPVLIFSLLAVILFSVLRKALPIPFVVVVMLLAVFPLWQSSFELFVPIVARLKKSDILPRLSVPRITEEYATLSVITALVSKVDEVRALFSQLELLSLKTSSRGKDEGAFWGILLDLPESKTPRAEDDEKIIKEAKKCLESLDSRFYLFTRKRQWCEADGVYRAYERKRGAIIELVKLLSGDESSIECERQLPKDIKYLLTLDADTDMELGALNKMVGTMAHPMNAPVIEKRGGARVVTKGFGVLQPVSVSSLESVHKTRFSTLMSGRGGVDSYHSAIFNLNSALFGRGVFCGKGMFSVSAFRETLVDAFPDNIILSHDILEGTRLRTGYVSDVCFFDGVPSNAKSYYKRWHRWARGDVQSLAFIGRKIKTPYGKINNPMLASERFLFLNNFFNLLVPIFQVLGLFFLMWYGVEELSLASFFFLLPSFTSLFNEILRASFHGSLLNILRKFFGDTLTALCRESIMLGYRLSSLAFIAYKNADAVIRSFWRMKVSGKKLLEWTTASQGEGGKNSLVNSFAYTFPSFVLGAFVLSFARLSLCRLLGILWCIYFVIVYHLDKPIANKGFTHAQKKLITRWAGDIWKYFDRYVDETNNYLPPDNVSIFPSSEVASRTSPTNIGLYLISILAALDFSFISLDDALERLEKALNSIDKLPKYKGQLYNWYSTLNLEVIGQEYISTVDSGNFITCLVALERGLLEFEKSDRRVKTIRQRLKKIEVNSDFRFLFNQSRNLFSLGYFVDREKQDDIVYDMYMSEARTTDYYAIARGIVKDGHWSSLSRPLVANLGGIGALSWSGTAFEYFMPQLLLPLYKNSFVHEALSYTFVEQLKFSATLRHEKIFGVSESGYFAFDENLSYQYRAFGIPSLSRRVEREEQKIISPYSSFIMLPIGKGVVIKNLEALERLGLYGEFGFYEAIDMTVQRPSVVKSFMSHHLGMSFIACANAVFDNVFVNRFMMDNQMRAVSELLKEAVPADIRTVRKERLQRNAEPRKRSFVQREAPTLRTEAGMWALTGRQTTAVFSERGVESVSLSIDKSSSVCAVRPVSSSNPSALLLYSKVGEHISSPSVSPDVSYSFDTGFAEYRQGDLRASVSLSARYNAMRIRLESGGETGEVGIYFEPLLTELDAFLSHPAFQRLFFSAEYSEGALILTRVGEKPYFLALVSNADFEFELSREKLFEGKEYGIFSLLSGNTPRSIVDEPLISPCVYVRSKFKVKTDTTFVIGFGATKAEALSNASQELATPFSRSVKRSRELFYSAVTASGGDFSANYFEKALFCLRCDTGNVYRANFPSFYGKNAVYSLGISGRLPVFLVKRETKKEELYAFIIAHKLHYVMGVRYELLIEVRDEGYMRGSRGEAESIIESLSAGFLVGREGGIHFVDVSAAPVGLCQALAADSYPSERRIKKKKYRELISQVSPCEVADGDILITEKPPVLWSHVIASETFGTILSHRSLGNTWVYNSRLSRLSYWENDSVGGAFSEKVIMEKNGVEKDLCASAFATRFSCGRAEYIGEHFNIRVAIHPTLSFKAVSVAVEDEGYNLEYSFLPVLDDYIKASTRVEFFSDSNNSVVFRNLFSELESDGFGYLYLPFEKEIRLSDRVGVSCDRGGEVVFVLGWANSDKHYQAVKEYFSVNRFSDVYALSHKRLFDLLKNERYFWLSYQVLVSRFMARSGPYQSGGAWGFRDQAQDCLTLLSFSPERVRAHIMRMASHQYKEGDVQHWWHNRRGVRTNCSDDYLWLVWLTSVYILRTNDKSVLGLKTKYLISKPLSSSERDRYEVPEKSEESFELSCHLKSALDLLCERGLGEHSLPYILGGDWNDGMNMLPDGSESVWLGFFARIVIELYSRVTGDRSYADFSGKIKEGLESYAFFSDRYARAFLPNGEVLGVSGSKYFEIDALPQAFSALCHAVTGDGCVERITLALNSAWEHLYDEKVGIYRLFAPPIPSFSSEIGYLSAYPEGVRENGGQYTHAAVWSALAYLYAPDKKDINKRRALLLAEILNPENHKTEAYKREPYVLCGDVYTTGSGGWSWYTGSASWYRDFLLRLDDEKRNNFLPLT